MDASSSRNPLRKRRVSSMKTALCLTLVFSQAAPLWAGPPLLKRIFAPHQAWGKKPEMNEDHALELTAKNIDWLEHQIDYHGTIVAKVPDVWGEARLTKYRREVEKELAEEVGGFEPDRINGAQFVSDQFRLAAALSIMADGNNEKVGVPSVTVNDATINAGGEAAAGSTAKQPEIKLTQSSAASLNGIGLFDDEGALQFGKKGGIQLEQVAVLDQHKRYLDHLNELRRINEGDDTADAPGYAMSLIRMPVSVLPGTKTKQGYGAEITMTATPEIDDGLLQRTFRDLVINDLIDQLSLPLVRLLNNDPLQVREAIEAITVLPGDSKDAAVEIEKFRRQLKAVAGDKEFVNFVDDENFTFFKTESNAVVPSDTFGRVVFESTAMLAQLERELSKIEKELPKIFKSTTEFSNEEVAAIRAISGLEESTLPEKVPDLTSNKVSGETAESINFKLNALKSKGALSIPSLPLPPLHGVVPIQPTLVTSAKQVVARLDFQSLLASLNNSVKKISNLRSTKSKILAYYERFAVPARTSRRSTLPFPSSQLIENYGRDNFEDLFISVYNTLNRDPVNREIFHLPDVQGILRDELLAAYRLLELDEVRHLWKVAAFEGKTIVREVRQRQLKKLEKRRNSFSISLGGKNANQFRQLSRSLAWMIYIESILLNNQLNKEVEKYCPETCSDWYVFFGPKPSFEAAEAFVRYSLTRWPLKIFTVDPVNTEQNIADVSIVYREMQLAVALSVASGNIGVGSAINALRQIQRETATIDLNRIAVGFTHGEDTFGWRFYPRFQTPPVEGNLTVFFRDALLGGPTDKHLEMKKEIEPGMRECTALVMMPSFVKGVSIETRSNWFRLDKPGHTAMSMQDSMKFSRAVEQMRRNVEQCVCNEHLYRPGEVSRVLNRVRQLDRELPLQTLSCQVPVENALGGFELLSSGTRELAPELLGWYGAPGYDYATGGTFFLVGNNFSVHETRVIAGGKEISSHSPLSGTSCETCATEVQKVLNDTTKCAADCTAKSSLLSKPSVVLLSRDVMQVTLPAGLPIVRDHRLLHLPDGTLDEPHEQPQYLGYVDVHAATPYGVSGHTLIPVLCAKNPCEVEAERTKKAADSAAAKKSKEDAAKQEISVSRVQNQNEPTVLAEVVREKNRAEFALQQLWYETVLGLADIYVAAKDKTGKEVDPKAKVVNVRAVITDTSKTVTYGSTLFENIPVRNRIASLNVQQQLKLIDSDSDLYKAAAASHSLMRGKGGQLNLKVRFILEGTGVKNGSLAVDPPERGGKKLQLDLRLKRGSAYKVSVYDASPIPTTADIIVSDELEFSAPFPVMKETGTPITTWRGEKSAWQPIGPIQPASWDSTATVGERLMPHTFPNRVSTSTQRTRTWNPSGKRSSNY